MFHIGVDIGGTFTDCVLVGEGTDGAVTYAHGEDALHEG